MTAWESAVAERWEFELDRRRVLPLRPRSAIAIKRDVHRFLVNAAACDLAHGFASAMADPARTFGLVQVRRKRERMAQAFAVGERFQGRFSVREALRQALPEASWLAALEPKERPSGARPWRCHALVLPR